MPIFRGMLSCHLRPIVEKVVAKFASWKGKLLSFAGRLELVKSSICCMLVHSFSVYKWSSSLIVVLERSIRNFISTGDVNKRKLVSVAWKNIVFLSRSGGLRVRNLRKYNFSLLKKLAWNIIHDEGAGYVFFRCRQLQK